MRKYVKKDDGWQGIKLYISYSCNCSSLGSVTCQWRTVPGSAKSPAHYQDSAGKVSFAPGVRNATIRIIIVDNNIPELEKTFQVELFAPTGGGKRCIKGIKD